MDKSKDRNRTFIKEVLLRDKFICQCCKLEGYEVHHIVPLCFGGQDKVENMICLCSLCHKHAPNSKEEFENYQMIGGRRYTLALGMFVSTFLKKHPTIGIISGISAFKKTFEMLQIMALNYREEQLGQLKHYQNYSEWKKEVIDKGEI